MQRRSLPGCIIEYPVEQTRVVVVRVSSLYSLNRRMKIRGLGLRVPKLYDERQETNQARSGTASSHANDSLCGLALTFNAYFLPRKRLLGLWLRTTPWMIVRDCMI